MEISRERINALQQQLEDSRKHEQNHIEVKDGDYKDSMIKDEHAHQQNEQSQEKEVVRIDELSFGPPQPVTPPEVVEEFSDAYSSALADQTKLKEELNRLREEVDIAKKEAEEAKQVNV